MGVVRDGGGERVEDPPLILAVGATTAVLLFFVHAGGGGGEVRWLITIEYYIMEKQEKDSMYNKSPKRLTPVGFEPTPERLRP